MLKLLQEKIETLRVYVGWKHGNRNDLTARQAVSSREGGIKKLDLPRTPLLISFITASVWIFPHQGAVWTH